MPTLYEEREREREREREGNISLDIPKFPEMQKKKGKGELKRIFVAAPELRATLKFCTSTFCTVFSYKFTVFFLVSNILILCSKPNY